MKLEKTLLGLLMYDDKIFFNHYESLHVDLFTVPKYKQIFIGISEVCKESGNVDIVSVSAKLKGSTGIYEEIEDIEDQDIFNIDPLNVIEELTERYKRLALSKLGTILSYNENKPSSETIDIIGDVISKISTTRTTIVEFNEIVSDLITFVNQKEQGLSGIATGFKEFDKHTKGLQKEDLIIVGAESSQGKTSFAISAINAAINQGVPVLFISLEMSKNQLAARILSNNSDISSKDVLFGEIDDGRKEYISNELTKIQPLPLYIDDSGVSNFNDILNTIKRYKIQRGIEIVVVDYLQLMNNHTKGGTKEQEIGDMARGLKNIAKQLKINIIALSQLSRDKMNPTPTMSRLRQSGQIEEAADMVILLFRPEYYGVTEIEVDGVTYDSNGKGMIYIAKGRNVGIAKFIMNFNGALTKWSDSVDYHTMQPNQDFDKRVDANHDNNPF